MLRTLLDQNDRPGAAVQGVCRAGRFGAAGDTVVDEAFLEGEEASFIAIVDGTNVLPLATSQDHKRLREGDEGPNTGGIGAYSPAPVVTPAIHARIMREVMLPTVEVDWDPRAAVGVVLGAGGYPEAVRKGDEIQGLNEAARLPGKVCHAGTGLDGSGRTVTTGGRVLCAVGLCDTVRLAQRQAYDLAHAIRFEGAQYRGDIGHRAVARESV